MLVDLVQTTACDGLRLDGTFQASPVAGGSSLAVDALCLVHGTGGSFYSSLMFDRFAERLLALGCAVLRVNTRGHDLICTGATSQGGRRLGAAYEVVDHCRYDLAAWLDWLRQRAGPRVGLLGHSLGAVKCLYALSHKPALTAECVVAVSPPRLSYSWFCASPEGPRFQETFSQAQQLAAAGQPETLLEMRLPLPCVMTAGGYVEKYGPDERYNYLRFAADVSCPTLITLGGVEVADNMAFRGAPEELHVLAARHGRMRTTVIAGADHFYGRALFEMIGCVTDWLGKPSA